MVEIAAKNDERGFFGSGMGKGVDLLGDARDGAEIREEEKVKGCFVAARGEGLEAGIGRGQLGHIIDADVVKIFGLRGEIGDWYNRGKIAVCVRNL